MKTETTRAGEFLVSEANGKRSRETITVTGGPYVAGQVLESNQGKALLLLSDAYRFSRHTPWLRMMR